MEQLQRGCGGGGGGQAASSTTASTTTTTTTTTAKYRRIRVTLVRDAQFVSVIVTVVVAAQ